LAKARSGIAMVVAVALAAAGIGAVAGSRLTSGSGQPSASSRPFFTTTTVPNTGVTSPGPTSTIAPSGGAGPATGGALDLKAILAKLEPAVIDIRVSSSRGLDEGTGIVITADGYALTNAHVVANGSQITVRIPGATQSRAATLIGADTAHDVALIKITGASGLTTATLGSSAAVQVGDDVVAIGNALGLGGDPTVTRGIVSALNRSLGNLTGLLQTDAAINPGNSGGPLVNSAGQVVGINTAIATAGGAQNIGFAIPIDAAKTIADRLRTGQAAAPTAFLGVATTDTQDGSSGAQVQQIVSGGPAEQAGIAVGDLIVSLDGAAVSDASALVGAIQGHKPGDTVKLGVVRNGQQQTVTVKLGTKPA
jgi:putative serine protease PepD